MASVDPTTLQTIVEGQLTAIEQHVDAELDRLSKLDDDDLAAIRQKRMEEMKKLQQQKKVSADISNWGKVLKAFSS